MQESSRISFSNRVKEELVKISPLARHCQIAEIAAIYVFSSKSILNTYARERYFTLLRKTINIEADSLPFSKQDVEEIKGLLKIPKDEGPDSKIDHIDSMLLPMECCKKSFIRGAFLQAGSVNDPTKSYHLEIVSVQQELAEQLQEVISSLGISTRIHKRKNNFVVYLRESEQLVDLLGMMGAPIALMELENTRIVKDMNNDLNRKVNCEVANIQKTVTAAMLQIRDIEYIEKTRGLDSLPKGLKEMAQVRKKYPEVTLAQLGDYMDPPIGKSGVNHRLRRISHIAKSIMRGDIVE